jgi:hypothetical protein
VCRERERQGGEGTSISVRKTKMVPTRMRRPEVRTRKMRGRVMMSSCCLRGGRCITDESTDSTPRDCARGPSMMMLIHKICMGLSGLGRPIKLFIATRLKAATDVLSWKDKKFLML